MNIKPLAWLLAIAMLCATVIYMSSQGPLCVDVHITFDIADKLLKKR